MEELLNQVDSKQADLRAVKQLQAKFLYCLNCYLTCRESLLEKLLLMKLKKVSFKLHAWALAEEAEGCSSPLSPILDTPLSIVARQRISVGFKLAVRGDTGAGGLVAPPPCTAYFGKLAILFGCSLPQQA